MFEIATFDTLAIMLAQLVLAIANAVSAIGLAILRVLLIPILQYNDFINHPVVLRGWEVVRDVVNIGFVAILLVLAFGTMFGIARMNWKQQIPRIFIAAIAVNFSRLITGFLIDIGQVIMVAFVNALQAVGPGNFVQLLQFTQTQQIANNPGLFIGTSGLQPYQMLGTAVFALMMALVVTVVLLIITAVLAYRIVVLWVLVILSPIAFLAGAAQGMFSATSGQYSQWWSRFGAAVMIGPILTFFLWLAMAAAGQSGGEAELVTGFNTGVTGGPPTGSPIISAAFSMSNLTGFIIAIALLMAGLEISSSVASQASSQIGNVVSRGRGYASKAARLPFAAAATVGGYGARKAKEAAVYDAKRAGVALKSQFYDGGKIGDWRQKRLEKQQVAYEQAQTQRGLRGAIKRAAYGAVDQKTKLAEAQERQDKARAGATDRQKGFGKHLGYEEIKEALENRERFTGADGEAKVAAMQTAMIGREKDLERWLQEDPTAARDAFQAEIARREGAGDDKGAAALRKQADKDMRLKHGSVDDIADEVGKWDEETTKKNFGGLKKSLSTRIAAEKSGLVKEIIDEFEGHEADARTAGKTGADVRKYAKQNSKYGEAIYKEARRINRSNADDVRFSNWHEAEKRSTAGLNKNSPIYKYQKAKTESTRRFYEAEKAGKLTDAIRDGLRLDNLDYTQVDATKLESVAKGSGMVDAIQKLVKSADNAKRFKDERVSRLSQAAAVDIKNKLDSAIRTVGIASSQETRTNHNVLNKTTHRAFNFNIATSKFAGNGQRRFENSLKSNPQLLLDKNMGAVGKRSNDQIREAVANAFDSKAVLELERQFEQARSTKEQARIKQVLKKIRAAVKEESVVEGIDTEREQRLDRTLNTFKRRIDHLI